MKQVIWTSNNTYLVTIIEAKLGGKKYRGRPRRQFMEQLIECESKKMKMIWRGSFEEASV